MWDVKAHMGIYKDVIQEIGARQTLKRTRLTCYILEFFICGLFKIGGYYGLLLLLSKIHSGMLCLGYLA